VFGFIEMFWCIYCLSTCDSPCFERGGHKVDFFGGHCSNCLFGELGFNDHYHNFKILVEFSFVEIEVDRL